MEESMKIHKSNELGKVTIPGLEWLDDFKNPEFIFSTTHTSLLTKLLKVELTQFN